MPLQPIPLVSQSYQPASKPAASPRLLNLFPEKLPEASRGPFYLKSTPGLAVRKVAGTGPILAMASIPGSLYVVSGSHLWRMLDDGSDPIDLGYVGTSPFPSIAMGATQVVVCSPPNAYVTDYSGTPLQQITTGSGNFPEEGASSVCYIDGYFIFTSLKGTFFFVSKLLDGTHFDSLDYATSERRLDFVEHAIAHNGELWLFGQTASAVWYNSGAADFPFRERAGSVLEMGLGAPMTVTELDGSLFFLGTDGIVYRTRGYRAERVSTHPIEEIMAGYGAQAGDLRDMRACAFTWEGHAFYALSLPQYGPSGATFVYDCATQVWHERCSSALGVGRWQVNAAATLGSRLILGDAAGGNLYSMNAALDTDNGQVMARQAVLPMLVTHGPRAFMSRLEVEMEVGTAASPGTLGLNWSDDGGITFTADRSLPAGAPGATRARVYTTRLGSFRQRVLRLFCSSRLNVYGVDADIAQGNT